MKNVDLEIILGNIEQKLILILNDYPTYMMSYPPALDDMANAKSKLEEVLKQGYNNKKDLMKQVHATLRQDDTFRKYVDMDRIQCHYGLQKNLENLKIKCCLTGSNYY